MKEEIKMDNEMLIIRERPAEETTAEKIYEVIIIENDRYLEIGTLNIVNGHFIENISLEQSVETDKTFYEYISDRRNFWDVHIDYIL